MLPRMAASTSGRQRQARRLPRLAARPSAGGWNWFEPTSQELVSQADAERAASVLHAEQESGADDASAAKAWTGRSVPSVGVPTRLPSLPPVDLRWPPDAAPAGLATAAALSGMLALFAALRLVLAGRKQRRGRQVHLQREADGSMLCMPCAEESCCGAGAVPLLEGPLPYHCLSKRGASESPCRAALSPAWSVSLMSWQTPGPPRRVLQLPARFGSGIRKGLKVQPAGLAGLGCAPQNGARAWRTGMQHRLLQHCCLRLCCALLIMTWRVTSDAVAARGAGQFDLQGAVRPSPPKAPPPTHTRTTPHQLTHPILPTPWALTCSPWTFLTGALATRGSRQWPPACWASTGGPAESAPPPSAAQKAALLPGCADTLPRLSLGRRPQPRQSLPALPSPMQPLPVA